MCDVIAGTGPWNGLAAQTHVVPKPVWSFGIKKPVVPPVRLLSRTRSDWDGNPRVPWRPLVGMTWNSFKEMGKSFKSFKLLPNRGNFNSRVKYEHFHSHLSTFSVFYTILHLVLPLPGFKAKFDAEFLNSPEADSFKSAK